MKGYWSHVAVYVGDGDVIHMLGDGIVKEDILIFMRCDDICILRPINSNSVPRAIDLAFEQLIIGVEYDYDFDTDTPKRFYCTEFVDYVYNYPVKNNIKNKYIIPDDFLKSNYFSIVWRKDNKKDLNND
ncbi:MAG: YiiX/YebB-like N1pC/P60 family cysteine hydrolase [Fermentimonas sp.]